MLKKHEKTIAILKECGLYYSPPQVAGEYTEDASGEFDPNQLSVSTKLFYTPKITYDRLNDDDNKMSIVITDPMHHYLWCTEEYAKVEVELWTLLLQLGFELSVWYGGKAERVQDLDALRSGLKLVEPQSKSHVKRHAKISTPDRTVVLDLFAVVQLLQQLSEHRLLSISRYSIIWPDVLHITSRLYKQAIIEGNFTKVLPGIGLASFEHLDISLGPDEPLVSAALDAVIQNSSLSTFKITNRNNQFGQLENLLAEIIKSVKKRDGVKPKGISVELNTGVITSKVVELLDEVSFVEISRVECDLAVDVAQLFNLAHTEILSLRGAVKRTTLTQVSGNMPRLRQLSLFDMDISPQQLRGMLSAAQNISVLKLGRNQFIASNAEVNAIIHQIPELSSMETFEYKDGDLKGIEGFLTIMPNLLSLHLESSNGVKSIDRYFLESIAKGMARSNKVTKLSLCSLEFSVSAFNVLINSCQNLTQLFCYECTITEDASSDDHIELENNVHVNCLDLRDVNLPEHCLNAMLRQLGQNVENLDIGRCHVEPQRSELVTFKPDLLAKLKYLDIMSSSLTLSLLYRIWQAAPALIRFSVRASSNQLIDFPDFEPEAIRDQPQLSMFTLGVGDCHGKLLPLIGHVPNAEIMTLTFISDLPEQLKKLESGERKLSLRKLSNLQLTFCGVSQEALFCIAEAAPNLFDLDISCLRNRQTFPNLTVSLKNMLGLDASSSSYKPAQSITPLFRRSRKLHFSDTDVVSNTMLGDLLQNSELEQLRLNSCAQLDLVDHVAFLAILKTARCEHIKSIDLQGVNISIASLFLLVQRFAHLEELSISQSRGLSVENAERFIQRCRDTKPSLKITHVRQTSSVKESASIGQLFGQFMRSLAQPENDAEEDSQRGAEAVATPAVPDTGDRMANQAANAQQDAELKSQKSYSKDEMIGMVDSINTFSRRALDQEKLSRFKTKLSAANIDLNREGSRAQNRPDIKVEDITLTGCLKWVRENYQLIMEQINEPLIELGKQFGHLSLDEIKGIVQKLDVEVLAEHAVAALSTSDFDDLPANGWLNNKSLRLLIAIVPEIIKLLKANFLNDKDNSKQALLEVHIKLTALSVPAAVQQQLIAVLSTAIGLIIEILPKLHQLIKNVDELKSSSYALVKILPLFRIIGLFMAYGSLIKAINALNLPEKEANVVPSLPVECDFIEAVIDEALAKHFKFSFETWETLNTNGCHTFAEFWQKVCHMLEEKQPETPNAIIYLPGENNLGFNIELMRYLKQSKGLHYFLNNLDDAYLTTLVVDKKGVRKKSATEFGAFCEQAKAGDVLVVNISKHRRGLNSLTDTHEGRQILTKKIADGVKIICLVDPNLGIQLDGDIYRRCSVRTHFKLVPSSQLDNVVVEKSAPEESAVKLYRDPRGWSQQLLGNIVLDGVHINFSDGLFSQAIDNNEQDVHMVNGPMSSQEFLHRLHSAAINGGVFINGRWHALPNKFKIHLSEKPYDLSVSQCTFALFNKNLHGDYDFALNPSTRHSFFKNHYEKNGHFVNAEGWLSTKKSMKILVNGELTRDQWAKIMDEVMVLKMDVAFYLLKKEYCPQEYSETLIEDKSVNYSLCDAKTLPSQSLPGQVDVIISADIDACAQSLIEQNELLLHYYHPLAEEDTYDNLFSYMDIKENDLDFTAKIKKGPVWKELQKGKTVLLVGTPSATLRAKLSTLFGSKPRLLINGKERYLKGRLIIVTDAKHDIGYALNRYVDLTPPNVREIPKAIDVDAEQNISEARFGTINGLYAHRPWVRVMGEYGVGKSYFAMTEFKRYVQQQNNSEPVEVFIGEENIQAFGEFETEGRKLLICDEYNLAEPGRWDKFRGMKSTISPGFIHQRVFYPTRPKKDGEYKDLVLFMANPKAKNYEGRKRHEFVEHCVPTVIFHDFPKVFLIYDIIMPIINATLSDQTACAQAIAQSETLCDIYYKIKSTSSTDQTISVRNLTMFVVRFVAYCMDSPVLEALSNAALEEAQYLLVDDRKIAQLFEWACEKFALPQPHYEKYDQKIQAISDLMAKREYYLTESRKPILKQLLSMLAIRDKCLANPKLEEHMIRGVLIVGETSTGKSGLLRDLLSVSGFVDGFNESVAGMPLALPHKKFYQFSPSGNVKMTNAVVNKGVDEGAINIVDEINKGMLEAADINSTLTGVGKTGKKPLTPGNRIWATMNPPSSYSDREPLSDAFKSRFIMLYMPDFPEHELKEIVSKICPGEEGQALAQDFIEKLNYGKEHALFPLPTPDDLFRSAKQLKKMLDSDSVEQYFQDDQQPVKPSRAPLSPVEAGLDTIKIQILQLEKVYAKLRSATFFETLFYPIRTFTNWLDRRALNREIHNRKHLWLQGKTSNLLKKPTEFTVSDIKPSDISKKAAKQFTTSYLMEKFQVTQQPISREQAKAIRVDLKAEMQSFAKGIDLDGETGKLDRKISKMNLWAEIRSKMHGDDAKNQPLAAFAEAKYELLEAEVRTLRR